MPDPDIRAAFNLPFAEQIEFFRQKLNLPTERWDDIKKAENDRFFIVAGAGKADLLNDLQKAVEKGIAQDTGLAEFKKDFRKIVAQRGWHGWTGEGSVAGENWRMRVIFETNLRTSYAAGRYAQLTHPDMIERAPYWVYRHSPVPMRPREEHLAWDGLTLRYDHPFWKTHYPPNGWGCGCYVVAVASPDPDAPTEPPEGWDEVDEKTGEPSGIDKGWDYAPGASVAEELRRLVAEKAAGLPESLARDFLAQTEKTGVTPDASALLARKVAKTEGDAKEWLLDKEGRESERAVVYDTATGKELSRLVSNERDFIPLPEEISALLDDRKASVALLASTKQRFKTATDPEGNPWKSLADSTKRQKTEKKMKAKGGRQYWKKDPDRMTKKSRTALEASAAAASKILIDKGDLSRSVAVQIVDGVLLVGVHRDFGNGVGPEVHQFGTRDGHIPAQPFLGLSKQDERTVLDILQGFLAELPS